jgi:hypothetical protein
MLNERAGRCAPRAVDEWGDVLERQGEHVVQDEREMPSTA